MERNKEISALVKNWRALTMETVHLCQQGAVALTCAENQAAWPGSVLHSCSYSAFKISELVLVHSAVLWGLYWLT